MKSIKPGRGPSMMGGIAGIFMIGFGMFHLTLPLGKVTVILFHNGLGVPVPHGNLSHTIGIHAKLFGNIQSTVQMILLMDLTTENNDAIHILKLCSLIN